ncbi:MAG TPA: glycosyl hydrolase family 28 protein [Lacipirellulaceae bacterium]
MNFKYFSRIHHAKHLYSVLTLSVALAAQSARAALPAPPPLPTFGPAVYNVTDPNPIINGGVAASTASADNAVALNAYVTYCSNNGGGTVEIPPGTFLSGTVTMRSNVRLKIDSGAILRDTSISSKLITAPGAGISNVEISGGGIIDGGATTTTSSTNLVDMRNVNTLAILNVTIQNAAHEHLVPINDTNVSVIGVTINDNATLAANAGKYLANTDGIDFAGNNFLFKNLTINCGDDNIVAKPANFAVNNVVIADSTIGVGHGISVGGGSAQGVSNMIVDNVTMNGTDNGLRLKAHDAADGNAGGGTANPVNNVTYSNITMTNVKNPIVIDSFYNGNNNFPIDPADPASYPASPTAIGATTPIWKNISFENITATGASNGGQIYGLNTDPVDLDGLSFKNVNISAFSHMNLWYAKNADLSGLTVTVPSFDAYANASPVPGVFLSNVTTVPEPATIALAAISMFSLWASRSRKKLISAAP